MRALVSVFIAVLMDGYIFRYRDDEQFGKERMSYKLSRKFKLKSSKKTKKKFVLLLVFVPLFLLGASFFVFVAAQGTSIEEDANIWIDKIFTEYTHTKKVEGIAGTIQFGKENSIPFYFDLLKVDENAVLFGETLPGKAGRTIILGQNEHSFVSLSKIEIGDKIVVDCNGSKFIYTVNSACVVVASDIPLSETEESVLTLVTKYPFRSWGETDRRYVIEAILNQ